MLAFIKFKRLMVQAPPRLLTLPRKYSTEFSGFLSSARVIWLSNSSRPFSKCFQSADKFVSCAPSKKSENQNTSAKKQEAVNKPRITKPTRPVANLLYDTEYQTDKLSSRNSLESSSLNSAQTDVLKSQNSIAREVLSKFRSTDCFPEESAEARNIKNYNYGLSGVGKVHHGKLKDSPAVTGEILYGLHSVILALTADRRQFHKCYMRDTLLHSDQQLMQRLKSLLKERSVDFETCPKSILTALSQARPHQGVCLDAGPLDYETFDKEGVFESLISEVGRKKLYVVLDSVQDPVNLGAIIRSSYFLGVDHLFVVKKNSCTLTPVVSKCSAGAMEICKIYAITNLLEFLQKFCQKGWNLLGTAIAPTSNHDKVFPLIDVSSDHNTILIIGNEGSGLSNEVKAQCHQLVTIGSGRALHPLIDSLNVSVATGILLHHLCQMKSISRNNEATQKSVFSTTDFTN